MLYSKTTPRTVLLFIALLVCSIISAQKRTAKAVAPTQSASQQSSLLMLVGTYTENSTSKGAYSFRFDQNTGKATQLSMAEVGNPSFIIPAPAGKPFAYAVSEYNDGRQAAVAFSLDRHTGKLKKLNSQPTFGGIKGGEDPCNLWTDGHFVVTANYSGGSISIFPIADNGSLLPTSQNIKYEGTPQGSTSHIHCVRPTPDGRFLLATDLGNDRIYRLTLNKKRPIDTANFLLNDETFYEGKTGWGPRHFVFSQDGNLVYLINELGDYVCTLGYGNEKLILFQYLKAYDGDGHGSADIHLSPDGNFLYASHRLKDEGLSIFQVDQERGMLTKIAFQPTAQHPRNFNITPNGKYLLVACRDANKIQVFERDTQTGLLTDTRQDIPLGKPVCISWAN